MKFEDGELVLDSGIRILANGYIVGISPDGEIFTGYDQGTTYLDEDLEVQELSAEQKKEIAEYMIKEWSKLLEVVDD